VDPLARLRMVRGRLAPQLEATAQVIAERVITLVVDAVDLNAILARIDLNAVLRRVNIEEPLDRIKINEVLARVDLNTLLAQVDLNAVLRRVDIEEPIDRVNLNGLLDRVDLNQIVQQVDLNEVIARIDLDAVLDRIDMNAIAQRIDVEALVEHTDLGAVIARSSSGIASEMFDAVRSRTVRLDEAIARWVARLRRRPARGAAGGGKIMTAGAGEATLFKPPAAAQDSFQGRYAGFASRFGAFTVDVAVLTGIFMLVLAAINFAASILTGKSIDFNRSDTWVVIAYLVWGFIYFAHFWGLNGRTAGGAIFGLQVLTGDGGDVSGRRAIGRTLAFPLSVLILGLGFLGILLGDRRRALHDVIAATVVVYSWDARAARLRFLSRSSSRGTWPVGPPS
jgi:uncharacterized RDD family membrane protein YckC